MTRRAAPKSSSSGRPLPAQQDSCRARCRGGSTARACITSSASSSGASSARSQASSGGARHARAARRLQRRALVERHHHVGGAVGFPEAVDLDQRRVVEARQQPRLVDEAAQAGLEGLAVALGAHRRPGVPLTRAASDDGMYSLSATWRCSEWSCGEVDDAEAAFAEHAVISNSPRRVPIGRHVAVPVVAARRRRADRKRAVAHRRRADHHRAGADRHRLRVGGGRRGRRDRRARRPDHRAVVVLVAVGCHGASAIVAASSVPSVAGSPRDTTSRRPDEIGAREPVSQAGRTLAPQRLRRDADPAGGVRSRRAAAARRARPPRARARPARQPRAARAAPCARAQSSRRSMLQSSCSASAASSSRRCSQCHSACICCVEAGRSPSGCTIVSGK